MLVACRWWMRAACGPRQSRGRGRCIRVAAGGWAAARLHGLEKEHVVLVARRRLGVAGSCVRPVTSKRGGLHGFSCVLWLRNLRSLHPGRLPRPTLPCTSRPATSEFLPGFWGTSSFRLWACVDRFWGHGHSLRVCAKGWVRRRKKQKSKKAVNTSLAEDVVRLFERRGWAPELLWPPRGWSGSCLFGGGCVRTRFVESGQWLATFGPGARCLLGWGVRGTVERRVWARGHQMTGW